MSFSVSADRSLRGPEKVFQMKSNSRSKFFLILIMSVGCGIVCGQSIDTAVPEKIIECIQKEFDANIICMNELVENNNSPLVRIVRGDFLRASSRTGNQELAEKDFQFGIGKGFPLIHEVGHINTEERILRTAEAGMVDGAEYYLRQERVGVDQRDAEKLTFLMMIFCHPASLRDVNLLFIIKDWAKRENIADRRDMILQYHALFKDARYAQMEYFNKGCWHNTKFFPQKLSKPAVMAGMKRAQIRAVKAIENVKNSLLIFPELQMFTDKELLTMPKP